MSRNVFIDVARHVGNLENLLIINDIDLSYMDTMDTNTTPAQQAMMWELHNRLEGGIVFMSGRSLAGIDKTFPGKGGYVASGEHHSVLRLEHGANPLALAPSIDTALLGRSAVEMIGSRIMVVNNPAAVREAHDISTVVYPEVKQYALALVHSLGHEGATQARDVLKQVAADIIARHGLDASHKIAVGNDAIEIVPRGLSPDSEAHIVLPKEQIDILIKAGLNKGSAVHNFMSLPAFANRTPFVVGDSGTDGVAMNEALKFGGGGIWVQNGKEVPAAYETAVNGFRIANFRDTWNHVSGFIEYCREKAPTVITMPAINAGIMLPPAAPIVTDLAGASVVPAAAARRLEP